jgi:hypothetical protein
MHPFFLGKLADIHLQGLFDEAASARQALRSHRRKKVVKQWCHSVAIPSCPSVAKAK